MFVYLFRITDIKFKLGHSLNLIDNKNVVYNKYVKYFFYYDDKLINIFINNFESRKDLGINVFEGELTKMIFLINEFYKDNIYNILYPWNPLQSTIYLSPILNLKNLLLN